MATQLELDACFYSALTYVDDVPDCLSQNYKDLTLVFNGQETKDGNYAIIVKDGSGNYFLAFRGSIPPTDPPTWDEFSNWILEDMDVGTEVAWNYPANTGAIIANGSMRAFEQIRGMSNLIPDQPTTIDAFLQQVMSGNAQIIITGHSLGANIANMYASYFAAQYNSECSYTNIFLCTFAGPASGNSTFAKALDDSYSGNLSSHFENLYDIVPKFPLWYGMAMVSTFFPQPAPDAWKVPMIGKYVNLCEAILGLSVYLHKLQYQQVRNNYQMISSGISNAYINEEDLMKQWICQVSFQHSHGTYSQVLGADKVKDLVGCATKYRSMLETNDDVSRVSNIVNA